MPRPTARRREEAPPPRFGAHMSIAGGHDRAVAAAAAVGCEALQVDLAARKRNDLNI